MLKIKRDINQQDLTFFMTMVVFSQFYQQIESLLLEI